MGKYILEDLAKIAYEDEDYLSAIRYKEQSMGITNGHLDFSKESIILSDYGVLANYYSKVGDWDNALYILKNNMLYWRIQDQDVFSNKLRYESALTSYASLLANSGRHKEALRVYRQLTEVDPSQWRFIKLGLYYYDIRDYQSAIRCYLEALKDSSSLSIDNCLNSLAICYSALGDNEKAIQIQKECISRTNPSKITYSNIFNGFASYTTELSNLASFYNRNEQYDSALVWERKSL